MVAGAPECRMWGIGQGRLSVEDSAMPRACASIFSWVYPASKQLRERPVVTDVTTYIAHSGRWRCEMTFT